MTWMTRMISEHARQIAAVYVIANALHCDQISRAKAMHVLRTHNVPATLSTLRSVSGSADMPLHVVRDIDSAELLGPPHVIAVAGFVDTDHATRIVNAIGRMDKDVALFVVLAEGSSQDQMDKLGRALIAANIVAPEPDLEPRQQVASALV